MTGSVLRILLAVEEGLDTGRGLLDVGGGLVADVLVQLLELHVLLSYSSSNCMYCSGVWLTVRDRQLSWSQASRHPTWSG